ncbi:ankyrin repeat-containing protein BDA1 [Hevea brasiliensis]|uniref:ankyrin repeat-containing protein BDA1 n=1 Tax=Hevea brasiliensis TaxID=3981 RepID=UPI0025D5CA4E|nr:ankyrin repeat-containing protein BDA1 [Hevea brasiliensis]
MSTENLNTSIENDQLILYQVSLRGDVPALDALLQQDELILDRVVVTSFHETPLHIAAMRGHLHFARALLSRKPKLAGELDSLCRLPLHLASAEGYTDIVKELITANPDACWARDQDGRITLHLEELLGAAAMKGRVDIIKELVSICPESIREKLDYGETILHLCVKYNRLEALKLLVETVRDDEFVNATDDNGNTILHLAAILKQVQITKYLLLETTIKENVTALNRNGFTALDALEHCPRDSKGLEVKIILLEAEAGVQRNTGRSVSEFPSSTAQRNGGLVARKYKFWNNYLENVGKRLEEARGNILVAATVTASMTFQSGINPPPFDKYKNLAPAPPPAHHAAPSFSYHNCFFEQSEKCFWYYNNNSLMFSLIIILLMFSGIPLGNKFSRVFLVIAMWFTVLCISRVYYFAVLLRMKQRDQQGTFAEESLKSISDVILATFCLIVLLHIASFMMWLVRKIWRCISRLILYLC